MSTLTAPIEPATRIDYVEHTEQQVLTTVEHAEQQVLTTVDHTEQQVLTTVELVGAAEALLRAVTHLRRRNARADADCTG